MKLKKLRVAYYRAGESSSQLSDESNLGVCLTSFKTSQKSSDNCDGEIRR